MNKRVICFIATAALASVATLASAADSKSEKSQTEFIKEAIQGNLAEQKVGDLAEQRGNSEGVRSFGATLKNDHSTANRNAMQAAQALGVTVPTEPNAKEKAIYEKLSKLSGAQFDKEFIKDMVNDHKKDVKEYEEQQSSSNATVARYAKETLPNLKKHLQTAENLQANMKSSS